MKISQKESMKQKAKLALRILAGILFIVGGISHFLKTEMFVAIIPPFLSFPEALVYITGIFEILGGIGVLIPWIKRIAGNGLVILLLAVFPANLHMAINDVHVEGLPTSPVFLWLRLPLQFLLIAWIWWCTREDLATPSISEYSPSDTLEY